MPYQIPWGIIAFRCVKCRAIHSRNAYAPYCSQCGTKQPDEAECKKMGLVEYPKTHGEPTYSDNLEEMNAFLLAHQGKPIAMWSYSVSHGELELRLRHSGGPNQSDELWLNTLILCTETETIVIPNNLSWSNNLSISEDQTVYCSGLSVDYILLIDKPADIKIKCGSVRMYFNIKPGY